MTNVETVNLNLWGKDGSPIKQVRVPDQGVELPEVTLSRHDEENVLATWSRKGVQMRQVIPLQYFVEAGWCDAIIWCCESRAEADEWFLKSPETVTFWASQQGWSKTMY